MASILALALLALGAVVFKTLNLDQAEVAGIQTGPCGLTQAAFCETFDHPAGTGNRSGQLNGVVWGVSRTIGGSGNNLGQTLFNAFAPTELQTCGGVTTVQPGLGDVVICNGQLREAVNDNGDVSATGMYAKQPFDFAGRTGVVTFDVSNDEPAIHTDWPEFWLTDQPVPAPFTHFESWLTVPRNGFGVRFAAGCANCSLAPACPNDGQYRWTVDSAMVVRNYVPDGSAGPGEYPAAGAVKATPLDCVTASPTMAGSLNHVEIHVSQNQIDIYATDAGTTAPLHHIGVVMNANLSLTRGLIWIEDVHYNAHKFNGHAQHTFAWDNVGFDGPVLPRDLTFDVLDNQQPTGYGLTNLGWRTDTGSGPTLTVPGVTGVSSATGALLTLDFASGPNPTLTFVLNGHTHTAVPPPIAGLNTNGGLAFNTMAVAVPLSEIVDGANTLALSSNPTGIVANIDLVLLGAGGGAGATPVTAKTSTPTAVPARTSTPVATNTTVPTSTPVATTTANHTCTTLMTFNGTPTVYTRPLSACTNQ